MVIGALIQWHRFWFIGVNYFLDGELPDWISRWLFSKSKHHQEKLIFFLKKSTLNKA